MKRAQANGSSRCQATNTRGERCAKAAVRGRFCLVHAGVTDMRALGRRGGSRSPQTKLRHAVSEDEELREQAKQRLLEALQGNDEKRAFEAAKSLYSFRAAAPPDPPAIAGQQALVAWEANIAELKAMWLQIAPAVECPACGATVGWDGQAVLVGEAVT